MTVFKATCHKCNREILLPREVHPPVYCGDCTGIKAKRITKGNCHHLGEAVGELTKKSCGCPNDTALAVHRCGIGGYCARAKQWKGLEGEVDLLGELHPVKSCQHCESNTTQGLYQLPPLTFTESIHPKRETAVCVIPSNKTAKDNWEVTGPRIREYARRLDADLVILDDDKIPYWPMGNKFRAAWVAEHYRQTLYLDCDVIVRRDAPNIFELVPDTHWGVVDELPTVIESGNGDGFLANLAAIALAMGRPTADKVPNGGVFVIPGSNAAIYKPPAVGLPNHWYLDELVLASALTDQPVHWLGDEWNLCHYSGERFHQRKDSAWFLHLNGMTPHEARLDYLRQLNECIA